jgi:hypothetical protein
MIPQTRFACGFTVVSVPWGEKRTRQVCRYECQDCQATIDYPPPGKTFVKAVDVHRKWLTAKGWKLNGHADRATCPDCRQSKQVVSAESPPEPAMEAPPPVLEPAAQEQQPAAPKKRRQTKAKAALPPWPIAEPEAPAVDAPPPPPEIQPTALFLLPPPERPTDEQRMKIRYQLDQHFDDATGSYLGYHSDETIALELGFPVTWIGGIRDVAYGAIRSQRSEMQKLRDFISGLSKQVTEASIRLGKLERAQNRPQALGE